jgi:hypothetical protein
LKIIYHNRYVIKNGTCFPLSEEECLIANEGQTEIYWTVNSFQDKIRQEKYLISLDYLYTEIDGLKKEEADDLIKKGLPPTIIIDSKNGPHLYWEFKNPLEPTPENLKRYKEIINSRLIPFYKSDKGVKDGARLLRVPGFYHWKDPNDPFLIKLREYNPKYLYDLNQFEFCYSANRFNPNPGKGKLSKIGNCKDELISLSGTKEVKGEIFSFKNNPNGTEQIYVNGKRTASWIDNSGWIGSHSNGGPTVAKWLKWYKNNMLQ